jgi:hypothetical protein
MPERHRCVSFRPLALSLLLAACPLLGLSCTADVSRSEGAVVTDRTTFDFTVNADRELFELKDLDFFGTVGPYAIYEVTGDEPVLDGPRVRFDSQAGALVMLCGAAGYFSGDGGGAVTMKLYGGEEGDKELTQTRVEAITIEDGCSDADDQFGERVPSEEPSGSASVAYTADEEIRITVDGSPPVGSLLLLRLVSVDIAERDHNNAQTVPRICCDGEYCTLASAE